MNMFWNRKLSSEWGSGAVVHMLRAAMIAAVVSSCSTSPPRFVVLAQAEEPAIPPLVMLLDPTLPSQQRSKTTRGMLTKNSPPEEKSAFENIIESKDRLQIVHVTISYIDVKNEERLLSLAATVPNPNNTNWDANWIRFGFLDLRGPDTFRTNFRNDVSSRDTGSPDTNTQCRRYRQARDIRAASDLHRLSKRPGLTAPWNQVQESESALEVGGLSRVSHRRSAPRKAASRRARMQARVSGVGLG